MDSQIQATGRAEFEDGVRIGNQSEAGNNFRGSTIPENKGIIVLISRVHQVPPGCRCTT